jgi:hypothetical protein
MLFNKQTNRQQTLLIETGTGVEAFHANWGSELMLSTWSFQRKISLVVWMPLHALSLSNGT